MFRRFRRAALAFGLLPAFAIGNSDLIQVTGIRSWTHGDSTRVILQTTGPFEYKADRARNPDRLFFDIPHARPWIDKHRLAIHRIDNKLVKRVRIAETAPGTTRVVFDLEVDAEFSVMTLETPDRMVIELRPRQKRGAAPVEPAAGPIYDPVPYQPKAPAGRAEARKPFVYPPVSTASALPVRRLPQVSFAANPPLLALVLRPSPVLFPDAAGTAPPGSTRPGTVRAASTPKPAASGTLAQASANASRSLTRALGLKVNRIVIDAGHGGHDDGTIGPNGVLEKDVVLDVALRLSKLVEDRLGAEVVLTRSDDTFIPLHQRTDIANERKADLFVSIHANSSPAPEVSGTETFFLNFSNSPSALEVAARENAGAEKNVGELKDLIQSITLNDKIEESHTFAQTVQASIFAQAARSNAGAHNRGVKRAPFVVLIGASMPSILAEIGFLSNRRDETNLGKPEYRQKIAEALYKGISQYSQSLSHFEVARERSSRVPAGLSQ